MFRAVCEKNQGVALEGNIVRVGGLKIAVNGLETVVPGRGQNIDVNRDRGILGFAH